MYKFRDVTDQGAAERILPSEALRINGEWLEDIVPGYRTLYTTGRGTFTAALETEAVGSADGEVIKSRRYPAREIVVTYLLCGKTSAELQARFGLLSEALAVRDAELVFNDEQEKYYTGTPSGMDEPSEGALVTTGSFTLLCADPFKYSFAEFEEEPDEDGVISFEYKGTAPAKPSLVASFAADCGYIALADAGGHILTAGNTAETDSQKIVDTLFYHEFGNRPSEAPAWVANSGGTWGGDFNYTAQQGAFQLIHTRGVAGKTVTKQAWNVYDFGEPPEGGSYFYGPTLTREIPADINESTELGDFELTSQIRCAVGANSLDSKGGIALYMLDEENAICFGLRICKQAAGYNSVLRFTAGSQYKTWNLDIGYRGKQCGWGTKFYKDWYTQDRMRQFGGVSIKRVGDACTITLTDTSYTFRGEEIAAMNPRKVQISAFRGGGSRGDSYQPVPYTEFWFMKVRKLNVDEDIANTFSDGDLLTFDTAEASINVNGTERMDIGAIGNQWDAFTLTPGENALAVDYSPWVTEKPDIRLKYREAYL